MAYINGPKQVANANNAYVWLYHVSTGRQIKFMSWLTQYEDNYESDWNQEEVFGRMDPIQTFKGTKRVLSLGWDVIAADVKEAKENLKSCEALFSMLYPVYEGKNGGVGRMVAPPLFKIKFLNLICDSDKPSAKDAHRGGLLGTVKGFKYDPDVESGFFMTNDNGNSAFPQKINLSFTLTVAHTHKLGWDSKDGAKRDKGNFPYGLNSKDVVSLKDNSSNIVDNTLPTIEENVAEEAIFESAEEAILDANGNAMSLNLS